jgi:hypothetical protein
MQDHPMIVPSYELTGLTEDLIVCNRRVLRPHEVYCVVVSEQKGRMQARDDQVLVVARFSDDRHVIGVARQILEETTTFDAKLGRVVWVVQQWRARRPATVDGVEVECGIRVFGVATGRVGTPSREVASKVIS